MSDQKPTVPIDIRKSGEETETIYGIPGETIEETLKRAGKKIGSDEEAYIGGRKIDPKKEQVYIPFSGRDRVDIMKKGASGGSGGSGESKDKGRQTVVVVPKAAGGLFFYCVF